MKTKPTCQKCGIELTSENWPPSHQKTNRYICKKCHAKRAQQWRDANPEKARASSERYRRKQGKRPFDENQECSQFLGVHIAEQVLSRTFKNAQMMPMNNPGFDFLCSRKKKIDVKSSCLNKDGRWLFHIKRNTIADYFLCLAFDNLEDLNPLHVWLLPGNRFNHLMKTTIRPTTIHKWDEYKLDITNVVMCCNTMRSCQ